MKSLTTRSARHRAHGQIYSTLLTSIINLGLAPGTAISESEISRKFDVSRTPVREAFLYLAREGLLDIIPQKETRVSLIDTARVKQELFIRESLEIAALERFLPETNGLFFEKMERLIALQKEAYKNKLYSDFINYDDLFHEALFEACGQRLSWKVIYNTCSHYHRIRMLSIRLTGIADEKAAQHWKILDALKKNDMEEVKKMFHLHLHSLDEEETLLKKEFPDYFVSP
ncbi:MAG: GntR family transcriptional regulator [Spirochaetes bacterium]|nr:GntR family transcriptional regulator [Spirochaetota bacterium]